jgi:tRNA A37 threonylcarbamoyladenosine dehydratase
MTIWAECSYYYINRQYRPCILLWDSQNNCCRRSIDGYLSNVEIDSSTKNFFRQSAFEIVTEEFDYVLDCIDSVTQN